MEVLGKRLKRLRENNHLTISFIAKKIEVSPSTYRDWEYGRSIKGEPYMKLARLYGVSLNYLMTGEEPFIEEELKAILNSVKSIRNFL